MSVGLMWMIDLVNVTVYFYFGFMNNFKRSGFEEGMYVVEGF